MRFVGSPDNMPKGRQFDLGVSTEENDTNTYAASHPKQLVLLTTSLKAGIYPNGAERLQNPHTELARSWKGPLPTPSHLLMRMLPVPCVHVPQVVSLQSLLLVGGTRIHPFSLGNHCDGQSQNPFPVDSQTDVCFQLCPTAISFLRGSCHFKFLRLPGTASGKRISTANLSFILFFLVS